MRFAGFSKQDIMSIVQIITPPLQNKPSPLPEGNLWPNDIAISIQT
jgi:hypothetical protein